MRGIGDMAAGNAYLAEFGTSTGASRWRRGTRRTHTARCFTTRRSWT